MDFFAKFVKPLTIKPNYIPLKKFAMRTYSIGKHNFTAAFPKYSILTEHVLARSQEIFMHHGNCVRIRSSRKKFVPLEQWVNKAAFVSRLQEKLERGAEGANYPIQI